MKKKASAKTENKINFKKLQFITRQWKKSHKFSEIVKNLFKNNDFDIYFF